ncbi:P13 [Pseudoplusia includens SNPV IE]|uniref:P13 n=2 Tax=Chrysodeixis includens nucleopolyhedrovirus TaxID=1207438 RepID=A0A1C8ZZE1_9ABAC|nr:P13 [Pseudoplusia includens SNPV IE]AOL57102.1 P13 [Chrysodeixis includens nucleopolyhedrovirus]AJD80789.1 P13 [Pseudoplusia includens SNPV IE]AOL57243.1 P13 [Chrysodeixis includens nucleopolyhedrovirus]QGW49371.1 P13 [Chrysodeixis includens nucleopolyhedrovirus]QGW49511.1 P13 [Chrysodeixis includens nucleopolyhedrovirus]
MYAYVTLVMLGDEYVKGALALAKSILYTNTVHDLVCMVTSDVSERAVKILERVYDKVVVVDFISYPCPPMLSNRQNQMYRPWIDYAFTKWQCLSLTDYDKILYLDADHIVIKNIDHLFALEAPALYMADDNYGKMPLGTKIDPFKINQYLEYKHNRILCKAGTVLFEPSLALLNTIKSLLVPTNRFLQKCHFHNGFDEPVLLQALALSNMTITHLTILYAWTAGSYHHLRKNSEAYVINYYGDIKPWHQDDRKNNVEIEDINCVDYDTSIVVKKEKYRTRMPIIKYMDVFIWKFFYKLPILEMF